MEEVLEKDKTHRSSSNSPSDQASSLEVMGLSLLSFLLSWKTTPTPIIKEPELVSLDPKHPKQDPAGGPTNCNQGLSKWLWEP